MITILYIRTNIHDYRLIKYLEQHNYLVYNIHLAKLQKRKSHRTIHCIYMYSTYINIHHEYNLTDSSMTTKIYITLHNNDINYLESLITSVLFRKYSFRDCLNLTNGTLISIYAISTFQIFALTEEKDVEHIFCSSVICMYFIIFLV